MKIATSRRFWYVAIVLAFNLEVLMVALHGVPGLLWWQWLLFPFAVLRFGRLLTYDGVLEPLRRPFTVVVPHWTGTGDDVEGRGSENLRGAIGDLLACPICSGTHAAMFLIVLMSFFPAWGVTLMYVLFGIGAAEFLNNYLEQAQWQAARARRQAGQVELASLGYPISARSDHHVYAEQG